MLATVAKVNLAVSDIVLFLGITEGVRVSSTLSGTTLDDFWGPVDVLLSTTGCSVDISY
jgi:hypothetical protein